MKRQTQHLQLYARRELPVSVTPDVERLLQCHAPVAFGVSGGVDGAAAAVRVKQYLDAVGHRGPRVLIHSHLGLIEWADSLPSCERLAAHTGMELVTVKHGQGGLIERWERRWLSNVSRYVNLECVKFILPWSTAAMRFCTSELKTDIICRELRRRFRGQAIVSVTGIRADESPKRAKSPVSKPQVKLRDAAGTWGIDWHPALTWTKAECFALCRGAGLQIHEAYQAFGLSRVSCVFCILASQADLAAAARVAANADVYRRIVDLEIASGFSFRSGDWLGDVAPQLLSDQQRTALAAVKVAAGVREREESRIPDHLLYTKGWPTCMPTFHEAALLADVRVNVSAVMGLRAGYVTARDVLDRYAELMAVRAAKEAA